MIQFAELSPIYDIITFPDDAVDWRKPGKLNFRSIPGLMNGGGKFLKKLWCGVCVRVEQVILLLTTELKT